MEVAKIAMKTAPLATSGSGNCARVSSTTCSSPGVIPSKTSLGVAPLSQVCARPRLSSRRLLGWLEPEAAQPRKPAVELRETQTQKQRNPKGFFGPNALRLLARRRPYRHLAESATKEIKVQVKGPPRFAAGPPKFGAANAR